MSFQFLEKNGNTFAVRLNVQKHDERIRVEAPLGRTAWGRMNGCLWRTKVLASNGGTRRGVSLPVLIIVVLLTACAVSEGFLIQRKLAAKASPQPIRAGVAGTVPVAKSQRIGGPSMMPVSRHFNQ